MGKEGHQRHLQELLSAARGALEEALTYATEHDLWFEFTGLRRGPGEELKSMNVDVKSIEEMEQDRSEWGDDWPRTQVDVLDISEEWVGSWC